jgi:hypothetical protein
MNEEPDLPGSDGERDRPLDHAWWCLVWLAILFPVSLGFLLWALGRQLGWFDGQLPRIGITQIVWFAGIVWMLTNLAIVQTLTILAAVQSQQKGHWTVVRALSERLAVVPLVYPASPGEISPSPADLSPPVTRQVGSPLQLQTDSEPSEPQRVSVLETVRPAFADLLPPPPPSPAFDWIDDDRAAGPSVVPPAESLPPVVADALPNSFSQRGRRRTQKPPELD